MDYVNGSYVLNGRRVFVDQFGLQPKIKLRESVPVSDKCREETNLWLLQMFGFRDGVVKKGQVLVTEDAIFLHHEDFALVREAARR